eukprot:5532008-Pyramimonas_sp.AAC.1
MKQLAHKRGHEVHDVLSVLVAALLVVCPNLAHDLVKQSLGIGSLGIAFDAGLAPAAARDQAVDLVAAGLGARRAEQSGALQVPQERRQRQ